MPPQRRRVMAWLVDGYTHKEIAEIMGIDVSSVRSHVRHARQHLKRLEGRI